MAEGGGDVDLKRRREERTGGGAEQVQVEEGSGGRGGELVVAIGEKWWVGMGRETERESSATG